MTVPGSEGSGTEEMSKAIAQAIDFAKLASEALQSAADKFTISTTVVGEAVGGVAVRSLEHGTETVGKIVTPIAENPVVKFAGKLPGISWLLTALGQVDVDKAQAEVEKLRQEYPLETPEQIAHRIIVDTSLKAGGIGLLTNFIPPLALTLFAVDLAAVTALQAEMLYRIAAAYGFSLKDPTRRGEVLAIFGLSFGGSGVLKLGSSFVELLPVIGAVVGASNNAVLIYSLGYLACRFYAAKKHSFSSANVDGVGSIASS
jgi:uncharacterized protein (DUF697 family)